MHFNVLNTYTSNINSLGHSHSFCICHLALSTALNLSVPEFCDQLGDADVVRLIRVQSNTKSDGTNSQSPVSGGADLGDALGGEVVDDA